MKRILSFILLVTVLPSFNFTNDVGKIFQKHKLKGSIVIFDASKESFFYYDSIRCTQQFTPASTFKIFNSLAALETGVIKDTNYIIPWDGIDRGYESWNKDHNLKSAFKYSAVWFYQELARRIGEKKMQELLKQNPYGNQNMNGGIDKFWLTGELRISQVEQIEFLKKLYKQELKFKIKNQKIVKDIMLMEVKPNYKLYAKSGWGLEKDINYGWYVGWVETEGKTHFFATNIETNEPDDSFIPARKNITIEVLSELGIIK